MKSISYPGTIQTTGAIGSPKTFPTKPPAIGSVEKNCFWRAHRACIVVKIAEQSQPDAFYVLLKASKGRENAVKT
jgi:hypothetical protein